MSDMALEDFLILRNLDESVPESNFEAAAEQADHVLQDLTDEGFGIRWVSSDVRTRADEAVGGTFCHYQAENEDALREHGARSGFPVTRIDHRGMTLENN